MRRRFRVLSTWGALIVVAAAAVAAPPAANRGGWICQGADRTVVASFPDEAQARATCQARAQAAEGGIFIVLPAAAATSAGMPVHPVILKAPRCGISAACRTSSPLSGRRGSWSWVPPTRLENGNIHTDLVHFAMYRQAPGGQPEEVAEISAKVTNVFWGMDTRDANACFWIEAVRVNSAPMPSDRSNRVCLDVAGQLLPQARVGAWRIESGDPDQTAGSQRPSALRCA